MSLHPLLTLSESRSTPRFSSLPLLRALTTPVTILGADGKLCVYVHLHPVSFRASHDILLAASHARILTHERARTGSPLFLHAVLNVKFPRIIPSTIFLATRTSMLSPSSSCTRQLEALTRWRGAAFAVQVATIAVAEAR